MRNGKDGYEFDPGIAADEKLKLLELSFENVSDAVYWLGLDGRIRNVNPAACAMLGYSRAELLAMSIDDIDPAFDPVEARSNVEALTRAGSLRMESSHKAKAGRLIRVEIRSSCLELNGLGFLCVVARDISGRVQAEKEAAFFRALVENTSDPIYVSDFNNSISLKYVNQAACRHFGMDRNRVLAMRIPDWDPEFDVEHLDQACAELKQKRSVRIETRHRVASGRLVPIELSANYLEIDGDEVIAGYFHDISARKRAEQALRENEQWFRVLAETSPAAICVYQGENHVYVNAAMMRLSGYSEEEFLGMKFWDCLHPDFKELVTKRALARQRGEDVPSQYEIKCISKSGDEKWVFVSAGRIEYLGKPAGIVTMFDITDRKRMEKALQQAHADLEKRVAERTLELRNANDSLQHEINERRRTESVIMARLRLLRYAAKHSLDDLLVATLDEAEKLTGSLIGFYHFLDPDQETLTLQNWSTRTKREFCQAIGKGLHYRVSAAGVWVDCIRQRRAVVHNDYDSLPGRKGLPEGHAPLIREMVVPVFRGKNIVAVLGVGNKSRDYTPRDVETVSLLADLAWEIAERKRSEEDLRQANLVVENSPVVLFRWKALPGWPVELISRNVIQFGYRPDEFLSGEISYSSIIHPEDLEQVAGEVRRYSDDCISKFHQEYRIITRAGGVRWVNDQTVIERNEAGEVTHYQGVIFDVSDRKRAEEALRESEARLRIAMELARLAPWEYDLASGLFSFDDQFYALYGTTAAREGGTLMSVEDYAGRFLPPGEAAIVVNGIAEVRAKLGNQLEHRIIRADGEERFVIVRSEAVVNQEGCVVKIRGANQDITERKRAEEQLRQKKQMLEEINSTLEKRVQEEVAKNREKDVILIQQNRQAALGEMLDHIAHQWKQPLNSIALIIQVLKESWSYGELTDEEVEEAAAKTLALVEHMTQTITVFRNFYRREKESSLFRLKDAIDRTLSFMSPALRFQGIGVELDVDPDLTGVGYPNEYAQVLLNILTNARETFKERRVEKPQLRIAAFAGDGKAVVTITDNAGGIPDSVIGRIFEMYFTTREASQGTGIGLYMSKNIIEKNMAGALRATNVGQGARFRIEINRPGR